MNMNEKPYWFEPETPAEQRIPPVPKGLSLRHLPEMLVNVPRLISSDFMAIVPAECIKIALMLWCEAWHQIPAGSLPDDDRVLAHLARYGKPDEEWKRIQRGALAGWIPCADGRLYHPVMSEAVLAAAGILGKDEPNGR